MWQPHWLHLGSTKLRSTKNGGSRRAGTAHPFPGQRRREGQVCLVLADEGRSAHFELVAKPHGKHRVQRRARQLGSERPGNVPGTSHTEMGTRATCLARNGCGGGLDMGRTQSQKAGVHLRSHRKARVAQKEMALTYSSDPKCRREGPIPRDTASRV